MHRNGPKPELKPGVLLTLHVLMVEPPTQTATGNAGEQLAFILYTRNIQQTARQHIFINKCRFGIVDKYEDIILPGSNTPATAKCRKERWQKKTKNKKKCATESIN